MNKEFLTNNQAIFLLILFYLGSNIIFGANSAAAQDTWISLLVTIAVMMPLACMYGRMARLLPEKNIYEIMEVVFGKVISKIFILLTLWYSLHLCAMVLRTFAEFSQIINLPATPLLVLLIIFMLVIIYLSKSGIAVVGKWVILTMPVVILLVIVTTVLTLKYMEFSNILPVMSHTVKEISITSYRILTLPFGEFIVFMGLADSIRKTQSPYKIFIWGILWSGILILFIFLRNLETLGGPMLEHTYFPSYITARVIEYGEFLVRIEGTVSLNLSLAGLTKAVICLISATKGMAQLFAVQDEKVFIMPAALLILALSIIIYDNSLEVFGFLNYIPIYAIPFQFIIPIIVWIACEVYNRRQKMQPCTS